LNFLDGIRVLDLSQFLPGPFATQMLSDMGADVVKVEPPKGDPMRGLDPITNKRGPSPYHALVNAGKRVIAIDLKSDQGKTDFNALVKQADVLLESYRPGVMARLGFGWESLQSINPKLIHCALSGFGQNGPLSLSAGHDINYVAAAGQLYLTGTHEAPHPAFPMVADYAGALQASVSILGALVGRGKTGQGAFIDVAMTDAVLAWQSQTLAATQLGNTVARDQNMLTGGAAFYQVYPCADERFISLGAIEEVFWYNFCQAVGHLEWVARQHEALPQSDLIKDVAAMFETKPQPHWDRLLSKIDCCFHVMPTPEELSIFPQHVARQLIQPLNIPDHGNINTVLYPAWVNGAAPKARKSVQFSCVEDIVKGWGKIL